MSLSIEQFQTNLVRNQQAEAANIVAYIDSALNSRFDLHEVDFSDLESKVTALNTLLDGDPNAEGYQAFQSLINRLTTIETKNVEQDASIQSILASVSDHTARITALETDNTASKARLDSLEADNTSNKSRLDATEAKNTAQDARLTSVESKNTEQDGRLDLVEAKNGEQDGRLDSVEAKNAAQDESIIALREADLNFLTRDEASTAMTVSAGSFIDTLWMGKARPAGLPNADGTVSA